MPHISRSNIIVAWFFVVAIALTPAPALAYLDPGSGSILLYLVVGFLATVVYMARTLWTDMRLGVSRLFATKGYTAREHPADIIIFSEGAHYWNVFSPLLDTLLAQEKTILYLAQHETDGGLSYQHPNYRSECIGTGVGAFARLNNVRAQMMIMTTPQLDIMMLRRSKNVQCYVHVFHAPTDALAYKKFAFDYFDVVLCSGPHQASSIRDLEKIRDLPEKIIEVTGLTYYDVMCKRAKPPTEPKTILIAPTWGEHAMFAKYGVDFIAPLAEHGYHVIVRPHPQIKKSQPEVFAKVEALSQKHEGITVDTAPNGFDSMSKAQLLISDLSGIIFDFMFLMERPVIAINPYFDGKGHEAEDVSKEIWEIGVVEKLCHVVSSDEVNDLTKEVGIAQENFSSADIRNIRDRYAINFGHAGQATAQKILSLLPTASP